MTYQIRRSSVENRDDFIQERERASAVGELQQLLIDTGRLIDVVHDIITRVGGGPSRTHAPFRT